MSKKKVLAALSEARSGRLDHAQRVLDGVDKGFVRRRLTHYKGQPDHRESALRLEAAMFAPALPHQEPLPFEAPLPSGNAPAPADHIDFNQPEPFLTWVSADWDRIPQLQLDSLTYTDVWVLVALGSLRLAGRSRTPPIVSTGSGGAARFAHALGLDALTGGREPSFDEPTRTVRLTSVRTREQIEPVADRMASMIIGDESAHDIRLTIRHVLVELLRNVVQHSQDPLGAVVAAQRMDIGQGRPKPMIQLAVADAGTGIPRTLHKEHPHLVDYRQALERALLPHISGTFPEGQTGSFENAGMGLYVISEMARQTGGRLLIATTGAALVLQGGAMDQPATPRFLNPGGTGFPGTLVAFEIPTDAVQDYHQLMKSILRKAEERTPKRVTQRWLVFEPAGPEGTRVPLLEANENTLRAASLGSGIIRSTLISGKPVELDFGGLELCTQSWLHALLFEPIRVAWALRVPIHAVNTDPAVREGLRFLESYALGG
jgi:hypothetical protein